MRPGVSFSASGDQSDGHHVKESWMTIGLGGLAPFTLLLLGMVDYFALLRSRWTLFG